MSGSEPAATASESVDCPPVLTFSLRSDDLIAAFGDLESRRRTRLVVDIEAGVAARTVEFEERIPVVEGPSRTRYVRVTDVQWFEAHNQYVRLHLKNRSMLARAPTLSISNLARRLDPGQFIRVHRSHIVNLRCVEAVETDGQSRRFVVLVGEQHIPVSQQHWARLRAALSSFGVDG